MDDTGQRYTPRAACDADKFICRIGRYDLIQMPNVAQHPVAADFLLVDQEGWVTNVVLSIQHSGLYPRADRMPLTHGDSGSSGGVWPDEMQKLRAVLTLLGVGR
jgi:hypothetical protein